MGPEDEAALPGAEVVEVTPVPGASEPEQDPDVILLFGVWDRAT